MWFKNDQLPKWNSDVPVQRESRGLASDIDFDLSEALVLHEKPEQWKQHPIYAAIPTNSTRNDNSREPIKLYGAISLWLRIPAQGSLSEFFRSCEIQRERSRQHRMAVH